ncbi:hypothetical protein B0H63DRAFT_193746 [Podospora didyma]|uniref:Uncharacterized protein n=1 Tax=Podospora didyma TaxID=330526 RepID=A0AAE0NG15_9PEZI|nr:hypothetical protein B0H63DRAFT_193746 [Podospora didyma]
MILNERKTTELQHGTLHIFGSGSILSVGVIISGSMVSVPGRLPYFLLSSLEGIGAIFCPFIGFGVIT